MYMRKSKLSFFKEYKQVWLKKIKTGIQLNGYYTFKNG